jgi:hypothetical protein
LSLAHELRFKTKLAVTREGRAAVERFCNENKGWTAPAICLVTLWAWNYIGQRDRDYEYPHCQNSRKLSHLFRFKEDKDQYDAWDSVCSDVGGLECLEHDAFWLVTNLQAESKLSQEIVEGLFRSELDSDNKEATPDASLPDPEQIGSSSSDFTKFLKNRKGIPIAWMEKMLNVLVKNDDWTVRQLTEDQRRFLVGYWSERVKYDGCFLQGSDDLDHHTGYLEEAIDLAGSVVDQALAHVREMFNAYKRERAVNSFSQKIRPPHFMSNVLNNLADAGILKRINSFSDN